MPPSILTGENDGEATKTAAKKRITISPAHAIHPMPLSPFALGLMADDGGASVSRSDSSITAKQHAKLLLLCCCSDLVLWLPLLWVLLVLELLYCPARLFQGVPAAAAAAVLLKEEMNGSRILRNFLPRILESLVWKST